VFPVLCSRVGQGAGVLALFVSLVGFYNGYWYWGRPSNEDLRRDLREITRAIRPDWDLGAPGLREKWEQGQRDDDFWPYGLSASPTSSSGSSFGHSCAS
jgi:hypothetical protein